MIRSNTHDQGCGLVMIGGPDGFGAGGWQGTPVEKALPVDSDIKALNVQGNGGLVLIMHASEMANGNFWQKKIAKLAIEKLSPADVTERDGRIGECEQRRGVILRLSSHFYPTSDTFTGIMSNDRPPFPYLLGSHGAP